MEGEGDQLAEVVDVPKTLEEEAKEQAEVSLNVLVGLSSANSNVSTIKIIDHTRKLPIVILIYSVSTHSFIDPHIVKILTLPVEPLRKPLRILVANGELMSCQFMSPSFGWKMQDEQLNFHLKLMKVGRL